MSTLKDRLEKMLLKEQQYREAITLLRDILRRTNRLEDRSHVHKKRPRKKNCHKQNERPRKKKV